MKIKYYDSHEMNVWSWYLFDNKTIKAICHSNENSALNKICIDTDIGITIDVLEINIGKFNVEKTTIDVQTDLNKYTFKIKLKVVLEPCDVYIKIKETIIGKKSLHTYLKLTIENLTFPIMLSNKFDNTWKKDDIKEVNIQNNNYDLKVYKEGIGMTINKIDDKDVDTLNYNSIDSTLDTIQQSLTKNINNYKNFLKPFMTAQTACDEPVKVGEAVGKAVGGVANTVGKAVGGVVNTVGKAVGSVANTAGNDVASAVDTTGKAVSSAVDTTGKAVSGAVNNTGKAVSGAINATGKAVSGVGELFQSKPKPKPKPEPKTKPKYTPPPIQIPVIPPKPSLPPIQIPYIPPKPSPPPPPLFPKISGFSWRQFEEIEGVSIACTTLDHMDPVGTDAKCEKLLKILKKPKDDERSEWEKEIIDQVKSIINPHMNTQINKKLNNINTEILNGLNSKNDLNQKLKKLKKLRKELSTDTQL